MTGAVIETRIDTTKAAKAFGELAKVIDRPEPVLRAIGTGLVEVTQGRFESGKDPQGKSWQGLNAAYGATKRGPGILRESAMRGGLMSSITFQTSSDTVQVGTNKVYAAIHQFGGTIKPKTGDRLVFRIGGQTVFARSVTIPARPYLGIGPEDEDMILDVVEGALDRRLKSL